MKKLIAGVVLVGLALAIYASSGGAVQAAVNSSATQPIAAKVNPKVRIDLGTVSGLGNWVTTPLNPEDVMPVTIPFTIKHNVPVTLTITVTPDGSGVIPTSALTLKTGSAAAAGFASTGAFLGTAGSDLTTLGTKGVEGRTDIFTLTVPYTIDPNVEYSTTLTYTITG